MAISSETTLSRLIAEINIWADANPFIKKFGYGTYLNNYMGSNNLYPAFLCNVPSTTSDTWYYNYNFEFFCLGWVFDDLENKTRENSDTQEIIRDFEDTVRRSPRWQSFSRIDTAFNYTKVDSFGGDKAYGWVATVTIKIKKKSGFCDLEVLMPTYDFENQSVVGGTCAPVTIYENDIFKEFVPSGGTFFYVSGSASIDIDVNGTPFLEDQSSNVEMFVKNTIDEEVGSDVGGEWIVPNAFVDFNGNPVEPIPSGNDKSISVSNSESTQIGTIATDVSNTLDITISDSGIELNGSNLTPLPAEQNKVITITHANGDPVVITPTTDTANLFEGTIPNASTVINGAIPNKTGANTSYSPNDDGGAHYGLGVNFWNLSSTDFPDGNFFGILKRFTGLTGGWEDETSPGNWYDVNGVATTEALAFPSDIVIDHSSWSKATGALIWWYRKPSATINGLTAVDTDAPSKTWGGFTGWRVPNKDFANMIYNDGVFDASNYIGFDVVPFNISKTTYTEFWTCQPARIAGRYITLSPGGTVNPRVFAQAGVVYFPFRIGNTSEL